MLYTCALAQQKEYTDALVRLVKANKSVSCKDESAQHTHISNHSFQ